jgi:hypothetical protein
MRNYELVKKIWSIVNMKSPSQSTKLIAIENLIKKERPEVKSKPATGCDYGIGG